MNRMYIRRNKLGKCYAEIISDENVVLRTLHGEKEIFEYLNRKVKDYSLKAIKEQSFDEYGKFRFVTGDRLNIVISKNDLNKDRNFRKELILFCNSKLTKTNKDVPDEVSECVTLHLRYLRQLKKEQLKNMKRVAILSLTSVVLIGAYKIEAIISNNEHEDEISVPVIENNESDNFDSEEELSSDNAVGLDSMDETTASFNDYNEVYETPQNDDDNQFLSYSEINGNIGCILTPYDIGEKDKVVASSHGQMIVNACETYGVDLATVLAIGINEFSLIISDDGKTIDNPFQIDSVNNQTVSALNTKTGKIDGFKVSYENFKDSETYYKIVVLYIKEVIDRYNNNPVLFPAAYNMGAGAVDLVLDKISYQTGIPVADLMNVVDLELFSNEYIALYSDPLVYMANCPKVVQDNNKSAIAYIEKEIAKKREYYEKIKKEVDVVTYADGYYTEKFQGYYMEKYGDLYKNILIECPTTTYTR